MSSYPLAEHYLRGKIEMHTKETFHRADSQLVYIGVRDLLAELDSERVKIKALQRKSDERYATIERLNAIIHALQTREEERDTDERTEHSEGRQDSEGGISA